MAPLAPTVGTLGMRIENNLGECSTQSAEQIKEQILEVPEVVLNVVAEDPQKPHVADHVHP